MPAPGTRAGPNCGAPWKVIEAFDADGRDHVERERRIEDERDRVLIAAVKLATFARTTETHEVDEARRHLVDAIGYLEQAYCASAS